MRPRRRTAGPTRERVGLLGWSGTAEVGEKDKSRGRRFGAPFRPSWRNPPGLTCSGHLYSGSCSDDTTGLRARAHPREHRG